FVRGERSTDGGDFTANAIAKDARLMIDTVQAAAAEQDDVRPGSDLPALRGALASLDAEIAADHGEDDFSTILLPGGGADRRLRRSGPQASVPLRGRRPPAPRGRWPADRPGSAPTRPRPRRRRGSR